MLFSIFRQPARPFGPAPVELLPRDLPRIESALIADDVQNPGPHPAMRHGKGQQPHLIGDTPASDEAWEQHLAPVLELCRPRGKRCRCGNSGTIRVAGTPGVARFCEDCKPRGVLGVVDGGDGAD